MAVTYKIWGASLEDDHNLSWWAQPTLQKITASKRERGAPARRYRRVPLAVSRPPVLRLCEVKAPGNHWRGRKSSAGLKGQPQYSPGQSAASPRVGGQFTSKALKERDNPESQITEVGCEKISTKFTKSAEKNLIRRFHRFPQMFAKNNNHESTRMNSNQKRRNDHKGTKAPRHQEEQACPADARMSGSYRAGDVVIPDFPWASPRADRTGLSGRRKRRTAPRKTNVVWPGLLACASGLYGMVAQPTLRLCDRFLLSQEQKPDQFLHRKLATFARFCPDAAHHDRL